MFLGLWFYGLWACGFGRYAGAATSLRLRALWLQPPEPVFCWRRACWCLRQHVLQTKSEWPGSCITQATCIEYVIHSQTRKYWRKKLRIRSAFCSEPEKTYTGVVQNGILRIRGYVLGALLGDSTFLYRKCHAPCTHPASFTPPLICPKLLT